MNETQLSILICVQVKTQLFNGAFSFSIDSYVATKSQY